MDFGLLVSGFGLGGHFGAVYGLSVCLYFLFKVGRVFDFEVAQPLNCERRILVLIVVV
jgi:hypothetical protein